MSAIEALSCAGALLDALRTGGLAGVVVSPGSRSTPLAIAASRMGLVDQVIVDERSAAFFALGRAGALGAPVALVCTSGTAAANYSPAIIEASQRRIPLVVLSADRPAELHGVGANQVIDQTSLFEGFLRGRWLLPAADHASIEAWRQAGRDAIAVATSGPLGPVHANVPFREPFIPTADLEWSPESATTTPDARAVGGVTPEADWPSILAHIPTPTRGVLSLGPCVSAEDAERACAMAASLGWPVVASVLSGARRPGTIGAMAIDESPLDALRPDLVVHLGMSPTTRGVLELEASASAFVSFDPDGWTFDPARGSRESGWTVTGAFDAAPFEALSAPTDWAAHFVVAEAAVQTLLNAELADGPLTEPAVARLLASLDLGTSLFVGNSTPIRDAERASGPTSRRVFANRGASGIDGLVSTLAGYATAGAVTGLLGDLSVLHDASGLLALASSSDATLVVIDNDGGGIFDLVASRDLPEHESLFATPHRGRLEAALNASDAIVSEARTVAALREQLSTRHVGAPMRIIRVPIDRTEAVEFRADLRSRVRAVLAGTQSA